MKIIYKSSNAVFISIDDIKLWLEFGFRIMHTEIFSFNDPWMWIELRPVRRIALLKIFLFTKEGLG